MKNKKYWDDFYKKENLTIKESPFGNFTLRKIIDNSYINIHYDDIKMIDIGCGNGRDTFYFHNNNINIEGLDISSNLETDKFIFHKEDILKFNYEKYNILYFRFIIHSLKESDLDDLLDILYSIDKKFYIFIETRSSKNITDEDKSETYFKSSVGEEHFRILYSNDYLSDKLSDKFEILYNKESDEFSPFGDEKPYCLRYILSK